MQLKLSYFFEPGLQLELIHAEIHCAQGETSCLLWASDFESAHFHFFANVKTLAGNSQASVDMHLHLSQTTRQNEFHAETRTLKCSWKCSCILAWIASRQNSSETRRLKYSWNWAEHEPASCSQLNFRIQNYPIYYHLGSISAVFEHGNFSAIISISCQNSIWNSYAQMQLKFSCIWAWIATRQNSQLKLAGSNTAGIEPNMSPRVV